MDHDRLDELTDEIAQSLGRGEGLKALALSDQLTSHRPEDVLARVLRAHALLATGSPEEALRECQVARRFDSRHEDVEFALALSAWRMGQIEEAERAFERALELSQHESHFAAQYAWFLASERGPRWAARVAEKVIGTSPRLATAWAALGLAQHRIGRSTQAEETLRHALELDPQSLEAQSAMIRVLKRRGDHSRARELRSALDAARRRYSLFVDSPDPGMVVEEAKPTRPVRDDRWGPLRTMVVAISLTAGFLALFPTHRTMAPLVLLAGALIAWRTRRIWY
jgi:Tfp pilus assembly protein PilF